MIFFVSIFKSFPYLSVVAVFICSGCNRKFAINSDPNQIPTHCRNCRDGTVPNEPAITTEQSSSSAPSMTTPSPVVKGGTAVANNPNKHLKPKVTRRGKFNALICKLCGISFFYRRCLLRHLRENHAQAVDVNNLHGYDQFIQVVSQDNSNSSTYKDDAEEPASLSQSSGMDITGSSQVNDDVDYDSLQNISTCDQSQLRFNDSTKLNQTDLTQPEQELNQSEPDLTQPELTEPPIDQSNLGLPSSSVSASVTSSIIEAVQNQAILEQASALLSQSNIETQSGTQPVPSTSLISHINPVADSKSSGNRSQAVSSAAGRQEEGSSGFREFKCTVCNKAFDRPYRLTRHLEIHDPNRPRIPCNYCSKTFTRKDSLESHIKTVHASVYPFTCNHDGCTRSFATRSMYLNHLKVHGDNKPYHCQECSDCFTLLTELKDHFRKEHPENESLRCTECFKVFSSLDELEEHKLRDHMFECENCGKVFARLAYLQVHVRVHNGESKFNCRFCSEGFNSAYSYRQHMKIHPEYRRVVNVFPCHPCGKSFQEPKELIAHYETPDHKEKAANVDTAVGPSTATSMMEGDLSVMGELMTDQIINSIVNTHGGFEEISSSQTLT